MKKTDAVKVPGQSAPKQLVTVEVRMERLYAEYHADARFEHLRAAPGVNFVPGHGEMRNPKFIIIGEAPGEHENRAKVPFVGPSGRLLHELLRSIDLKREHIWTTNLLKYHPHLNRDPRPDEVQAAFPYLIREIRLTEGTLLVPLGRFAFNCFFPTLKISDARGMTMSWHGFTVFPMFHPAVALYNPSNRPIMFEDMKELGALIE